jgi:hypothetical protein
MAAFAMNDDCSVLRQSTKQVLVLLAFLVHVFLRDRHFSADAEGAAGDF